MSCTPGVGALEEASAHLVFQSVHLAGERRLGLVQPGGGAAEAAFLDDHKERAQLGQHSVRGYTLCVWAQSTLRIT